MKMPQGMERFLPIYVVLGRPPTGNSWKGRIEYSFSMGWSQDRIRLFWSGKAYSFLGEHILSGEEDARDNALAPNGWEVQVFDLSSEDCPIEVDLGQWMRDLQCGSDKKFEKRNALFTMRDEALASRLKAEGGANG